MVTLSSQSKAVQTIDGERNGLCRSEGESPLQKCASLRDYRRRKMAEPVTVGKVYCQAGWWGHLHTEIPELFRWYIDQSDVSMQCWCLLLSIIYAPALPLETDWYLPVGYHGSSRMYWQGVGRFVDKTFRRRISGRFVDSIRPIAIRNTPTPWLFKLLIFSFIRPKLFSNCISISNQTFSCIHWHCSCMLIGRGRSPGRADRVSAGPVVSNSEPLSPHRTLGLACGGAA